MIDPATDVAFHSASGAASETRHVYLRNSDVAARLARKAETRVLEIGLGTGLGLLMTIDAAVAAGARLHYDAIEREWLSVDVLRRLKLDESLADPSIAEGFLRWRESLGIVAAESAHRWSPIAGVDVTVYHADARRWAAGANGCYDAIYFDPFAPEVNPKLWKAAFLRRMLALLGHAGRLVTYCVNRRVRDEFAAAGFTVERVRGPQGGKREVLVATPMGGK